MTNGMSSISFSSFAASLRLLEPTCARASSTDLMFQYGIWRSVCRSIVSRLSSQVAEREFVWQPEDRLPTTFHPHCRIHDNLLMVEKDFVGVSLRSLKIIP